AAAVHLPELAADSVLRVFPLLREPERLVEKHEVERRPDPGDRGDHVQPAEEQVEPVAPVGVEREHTERAAHPVSQRSRAIATSSRQPVSSSCSSAFPILSRRTSRTSRFERPATKTTNRKPNFSS